MRVLVAQEALRVKLTGDRNGWCSSSQVPRSENPFPQYVFYPWQAPSGWLKKVSQKKRITESQNGRGWKGPLWVI